MQNIAHVNVQLAAVATDVEQLCNFRFIVSRSGNILVLDASLCDAR